MSQPIMTRNISGRSITFYDVALQIEANNNLATVSVVPYFGQLDIGIRYLFVHVTRSSAQVNPIAIVRVSGSPDPLSLNKFTTILGLIQEAGSFPVAFSVNNVGGLGYLDTSVIPSVPIPAIVDAAQLGDSTFFYSGTNTWFTGNCYIDAQTNFVGEIGGIQRLWGTIRASSSITSLTAQIAGYSPLAGVDVPYRTLKVLTPQIGLLNCERMYVDVNNGVNGGATNASQITAFGIATSASPDSGGIFGNLVVQFSSSPNFPTPRLIANGDVGAKISVANGIANTTDGRSRIVIGRTLRIEGEIATTLAASLSGQVVINERNDGGGWLGLIRIGANSSPIEQSAMGLGVYASPSNIYGGGAVGLVPFRLYQADSTLALWGSGSPAPDPNTEGTLLDSVFNRSRAGTDPLRIAFFGPVKKSDSASPCLKVELIAPSPAPTIDVTSRVNTAVDPTNPRRIVITPKPAFANAFMPGRYLVTNPATGAKVLCDIPPSTSAVPVQMPDGYTFDLGRDLDGNGVLDKIDIATKCVLMGGVNTPRWTSCDCPDKNRNGVLDAYETGLECIADLNDDTVVNDLDFQIFSVAYDSLYDYRGDMNGDSITDDADFTIFAILYDVLDCEAVVPLPCGPVP